ncbi:MAG: GspE/PulE family protein [Maricaulaceae bacterium]
MVALDVSAQTDEVSAPPTDFEDRLGAALLSAGVLDDAGLERARAASQHTQTRLTRTLLDLGLAGETDLARACAQAANIAMWSADTLPEEPVCVDRLPLGFLRQHHLVPLDEGETAITVATFDPGDAFALKAVRLAAGKSVTALAAAASQIDHALEQLYAEPDLNGAVTGARVEAAETVGDQDLRRLEDMASEAPVVRLVNTLITRAADLRASDIHLDAVQGGLRNRFRLDGVLVEQDPPPRDLSLAVVSRLKLLAGLNIAERRLPQDGRIQLSVRGRRIDLRVATLPALHGESVVIRVLDQANVVLDFASLGFRGPRLDAFLAQLRQPNGLVLVTGPTGSGKTTTLYTALKTLNAPGKKIITAEDPIEYELPGVVQVQTKAAIGLGFAPILRSVLRHNPDIILVGEIRDKETAEIAIHAALTGHLVLSTLHTNSAAASIGRLLDMGVEDYLLASTLNAVLAQRLMRSLCGACKTPETPDPSLVAGLLGREPGPEHETPTFRAQGCEACRGSGYRGRTVAFELLELDRNLRDAILKRPDAQALEALARERGFVTLREDAVDRALRGETALDEVVRVTREV